MSEIKKAIPTAGGDASVVETIKSDRDDNFSQSVVTTEPEHVATPAEKIPTSSVLTEPLVEANNTKILSEEIINSSTRTVEAAGTTTEITSEKDSKECLSVERSDPESLTSPVEVRSLTAIALEEIISQEKFTNEEKIDKSKQNTIQTRDNDAISISRLEAEVRKRTRECDSYQKKLENTEKKLATLQASYNAIMDHDGNDNVLQESVEQLRVQLVQTALMYEERNRVVANQENQINALNNQVASLKEVVSITRDLLQIRNMEVKQLQAEVDNMEKKIAEERERHNTMINKMDSAMRLNADLKKEYETQLSLFQSLREKYGEKINLLSEEKRIREAAVPVPE